MRLDIEKGIFWLNGKLMELDKIKLVCDRLNYWIESSIAADESEGDDVCLCLCYNSDLLSIEEVRWRYMQIKKEISR